MLQAYIEGIMETCQVLDLASTTENATEKFSLFPGLPPELRIKIWEATFSPRVIMLKRHSDRPRLEYLTGALLLVNHEAHRVFSQYYTFAFDAYGLRGIYIDFALDTLFLNSHSKALRLLLKQYPTTMGRIKWRYETAYVSRNKQLARTAVHEQIRHDAGI